MMRKFLLATALVCGLAAPAMAEDWKVDMSDEGLAVILHVIPCEALNNAIDEQNDDGLRGSVRMQLAAWRLLNHNREMPESAFRGMVLLCRGLPKHMIYEVLKNLSDSGIMGNQ